MTASECTTQHIETVRQSARARQISQLRQTSARLAIGAVTGMGGGRFPSDPPAPPKPVALVSPSPGHQLFKFICDIHVRPIVLPILAIMAAGPKPRNRVILSVEKGSG